MIGQPSPRLRAYVTAGIVGLIAALAVGDPSPALVGAVLLALGAVGLAGGVAPRATLTALDVPTSAVEGEQLDFTVRIAVDALIGRTFVDLGLSGLELAEVVGARMAGPSTISLMSVREVAEVRVTVEPIGWGKPLSAHWCCTPTRLWGCSISGSRAQGAMTSSLCPRRWL